MPILLPSGSSVSAGVRLNSINWSPRSTSTLSASSGLARIISTHWPQPSTPWPATLTMRSPANKPAWSPACPSTNLSITAGMSICVMPKSLSGRGSVESAMNPRMGKLTSRSAEESAPFTEKVTLPLSPIRPINCRATCCQISVGSPSTARISSPDASPARSATEPSTTELIIGATPDVPYAILITQKITIASRKLAAGPAAEIAIRCQTLFAAKDFERSSAGTASASGTEVSSCPSMRTYPPSGMGAITYSTPSFPTQVLTALPKPIENLRTLTPQRLATQKWPNS